MSPATEPIFDEAFINSPAVVFRMKLELPPELRGVWKGDASEQASQAMSLAMRSLADLALDRLQKALAVGGKYKVGATGTASRNFVVEFGKMGKSLAVAEIMEGTATKANFFIRTGSTGHGKPPPVEAIEQWLVAKRIPLYLHEVWKAHRKYGYDAVKVPHTKARAWEQVRYTKPHSGRPVRPWKRSKNLFDEVAEKIIWSIAFSGTSKFSLGRPPVGRRYFDYLWYVAEQQQPAFQRILSDYADIIARVFIEFALSGKRETGMDRLMQERFRYRTYS
jgi:hypothetical protein